MLIMAHKKPTPFSSALPIFSKEWIKALRQHRGLNQTQAAKLCGVSQAAWSQWESGATVADKCCRKLLELIAKATI